MAVKRSPGGIDRCRAYCARQVVRETSLATAGRIHTCPFGHTEIVVPVIQQGRSSGLLIAGPWWCGKGQPPRSGLTVSTLDHLGDLHEVVIALALRCAVILDDSNDHRHDRRQQIQELLERRYAEDLHLSDVARELRLSSSRCGHLVHQLFGRTFPALLREVRLEHATRRLLGSDDAIGDIATLTGFTDASYFSRVFRVVHGCGPSEFRSRPAHASV